MRIIIIRHGDPNYEIDNLTEKGKREAALLAERMAKEKVTAIYCSPLGRARATAMPTEERLGITAEVCEWLREFNHYKVKLPYREGEGGCWDLLPEFVDTLENIYHPMLWREEQFLRESEIPREYDRVVGELDALISRHGYDRSGKNYLATRPNHDTVVLVCHYGVTAVLLSHLLNCSPYSIWQNAVTLPTSVTTLYTEERREGKALFRMAGMGDLSHLYAADEPPSPSARFCECYTDDTRHD